ncbi:hypothetical protein XENTR_v10017761 [Xenopus tropicalis]|nr:hypothetical protein XENTR_v10017761 [Xenopus tropicalis]
MVNLGWKKTEPFHMTQSAYIIFMIPPCVCVSPVLLHVSISGALLHFMQQNSLRTLFIPISPLLSANDSSPIYNI